MRYDVTILQARPGTAGPALAKLKDNLPAGRNQLVGCWSTDIGALNRILLISAVADEAELAATRARLAANDNPFGIGEYLQTWSSDSYELFPFLDPIRPGAHGAFYEVRTYLMRPNGVPATIEAWRAALPARLKMSPMYCAMYSITGTVPRFMHIWPWPDLNTRHAVRSKAVETGVWPPKGGADRFHEMRNDIYLPAPFSPSR